MDSTHEPSGVEAFVEDFHRAIDEEILAIQDDLGRRGIGESVTASGGHEVDGDSPGFVYDWTLPAGRYVIRADDAVRVDCQGGEALGFVNRWDPGSRVLRVTVPEWLGRLAGTADLTFDPTWLLAALGSRLAAIAADPGAFHTENALRLFGARFPETGSRRAATLRGDGLNACQTEALERILGSRTQLVWGPPGTGKTLLLGHAVRSVAGEGRVLVLATTNVAVDEAALRVASSMGPEAVAEGRVVRLGAGYSPSGESDLSVESIVQRKEARDPGRFTQLLGELEAELGLARSRSAAGSLRQRYGAALAAARAAATPATLARAGHLTSEWHRAGARVLGSAHVVLTTFARMTLRDDLWALRFRSVFVDEASAAPLPYVFAGACLASERAVAMGDFQQLPPVVMSAGGEASRWLSTDIFRQSGAIDPEAGRPLPDPRDDLCATLTEQYRMAPPIRALVSELFYGGRLSDAPSVSNRQAAMPPLLLVDTEALGPAVERAEGSRANAVHIAVLIQLLELLGRHGIQDVGVVTPYRVQSRRVYREVRSRLGRSAPSDLEVATIHRFQGREKDAVILDTVDAPPGGSWFLNERRNPDFPRLLNVALSRSRASLIVVGTAAGLRKTLPPDALLVRTVDTIRERGATIDAARLATDWSRLRAGAGRPSA